MGAASDTTLLARALRNPGRLVLNPSNLAGTFPYGGTSLGFVREARLSFDVAYRELRDPTSGAVLKVVRKTVEVPRLAVALDGPQWDENATAGLFTKTTAAASLPHPSPAETRLEGTLLPAVVPTWGTLLFDAEDPKHPSVGFRNAVPKLDPTRMVAFARLLKASLFVVFVPVPDTSWTSSPYWSICRRENMTL